MFLPISLWLSTACLTQIVSGQGEAAPRKPLHVTGARVARAEGEGWLENATISIDGDRIVGVFAGDAPADPRAERIDATGLTIVPGLIDLHTHLLLHPYDEAPWEDQVVRESLESRVIRATAAARATLEAGITTIRELGTEGAGIGDVALRDAVRRREIPGPRIEASTFAIVASGSYAPKRLDPRVIAPRGAEEITGAEEARRAARRQIGLGADWVKVYADYARGDDTKATPTLTKEELEAVCDEARSAGRRVAAHATTAAGILRAVMAGVATIEHGDGADDSILELMRERNVVLCPTLAASEAMARYQGWKHGEPEPARLARSRDLVARARKVGVTIAFGSDAGVFRHGDNARELELLASSGMPLAEVLRAATATPAAVLGRERELGKIEKGFLADFVGFRGDPLKDAAAYRQPALVVQGGRVIVARR
jgi:imidazolonepropionase-like amidohydrolase